MKSFLTLFLVGGLLCSGCHSSPRADSRPQALARAQVAEKADSASPEKQPYILFNQRWIEGSVNRGIDLADADAVFQAVFEGLPDEVIVYPSENYYYFILFIQGRQVWGNIRLAAGHRENGVLSFGYFEFTEFPIAVGVKSGINGAKFYTQADGVSIREIDRFTYSVGYRGKEVVFHLHRLRQEPPKLFALGDDEVFVERTFDESGYQFFLLFNRAKNYFIWVLNEEEPVPDTLEPDKTVDDLVLGARSGFAFWLDRAHGNRKVMLAIRKLNSRRNDYYDGPFDQLADNYADEAKVSEYMVRAAPALRGRIDKYGYYTDKPRPMRVALACYYTYLSNMDLMKFVERAKASEDIYQYISRRGIPTRTQSSDPPAIPDDRLPDSEDPEADEEHGPSGGEVSRPKD